MISFKSFFKRRITKFFTFLFAGLLLMSNIGLFVFSSIQYNREIERQKTSILEMLSHLITQEDENTAATYLEHYVHTHSISIIYYNEFGVMLYQSEQLPQSEERLYILSDNQTIIGEITIDFQYSIFGSEMTIGLFIVNGFSIFIFIFTLIILYRYMNVQYQMLDRDLKKIGSQEPEFKFLDIEQIHKGYMKSVDMVMELKDLQAHYVKAVAHDIKTPLTVIRTYLEGVQTDRIQFSDTINQEILDEIKIIENLIPQFIVADITQLPKNQNITDIVNKQLDKLIEIFATKNIQIEREMENLNVYISTVDVKRMIEHLVFNAFYYSLPKTKIRIAIEASSKKMIVSDSGIGMSADTIQQILQGPYRDPKSTLYHQKGTGIGLQIVFEIVKRNNATIHIESIPNQGTTVSIQFK